jgi:hypothetical protein
MIKDPKQGYKGNMVFSGENYSISNNDASNKNYLYHGSAAL